MNQIRHRIAEPKDQNSIFEFAKDLTLELEKNKNQDFNEFDLMMKIWESKFRLEALEHYLKFGWSFVAESESSEQKVEGFFIGQPILFLEGYTQNLWIECVMAKDEVELKNLVEIGIKLSRDKHLQRVILPLELKEVVLNLGYKVNSFSESYIWVKTTK